MSDPEARNVYERALAQQTCLHESCASLGNITKTDLAVTMKLLADPEAVTAAAMTPTFSCGLQHGVCVCVCVCVCAL